MIRLALNASRALLHARTHARGWFVYLQTARDEVYNTPIITNLITLLLVVSFLLRYLIDTNLFANQFALTVNGYQYWRIVTTPLVYVAGINGAQMLYMRDKLKEMELIVGSILMLVLFVNSMVAVNCLHLIITWSIYFWTNDESILMEGSGGTWSVFLAIVGVMRYQPAHEIGSVLHPFILTFFFSGQLDLTNVLGLIIGYVFGRTECWKVKEVDSVMRWETSLWEVLVTRRGFVSFANSREHVLEMEQRRAQDDMV